jgi:sec-independent protein translocase protein TatA
MFGRPGTGEIVLIIIALILLFGAKRIPDLARSIGQALHMFRKGLREDLPEDSGRNGSGNGEKPDGDS